METINLEITIGNETRTIEFKCVRDDMAWSADVFAARIGNGAKFHRSKGMAFNYKGVWTFEHDGFALNKRAKIVKFADQVEFAKSQHGGSKIK
jgi:hypothetical protein